jgi:hypothetical protein
MLIRSTGSIWMATCRVIAESRLKSLALGSGFSVGC